MVKDCFNRTRISFLVLAMLLFLITTAGCGGGGGAAAPATAAVSAARAEDTDCDGISNDDEIVLNTDSTTWDTDGDGLGDLEEFQLKLDPENPDTDGDGQQDGAEFASWRDANDPANKYPDGNRNGLADNWENHYGVTDPNDDPDHDLFLNKQEFKNGTSPIKPDTDDDGVPDYVEVIEVYSHPGRPSQPAIDEIYNHEDARWGSLSSARWQALQASIDLRLASPPVVPQTSAVVSCWIVGDIQHMTYFTDAESDALFGDGHSWPDLADMIATGHVADTLGPACVIFVGDFVDRNQSLYWDNFRQGLDILDRAGIPYFFTLGNHDVGSRAEQFGYIKGFPSQPELRGEGRLDALSRYYLPPGVYQAWESYGGSYDSTRTDNTWHRFTAAGRQWVVLSIEYNPRDSVLEWADGVVKANAGANIIITTHSYMAPSGLYSADGGQRIRDQIIYPNDNVIAVVGGHHVGPVQSDGSKHPGVFKKGVLSTDSSGRKVFELFFNRQAFTGYDANKNVIPGGEDGTWTTLLSFHPAQGKIVGRVLNSSGQIQSCSLCQFSLTGFLFK